MNGAGVVVQSESVYCVVTYTIICIYFYCAALVLVCSCYSVCNLCKPVYSIVCCTILCMCIQMFQVAFCVNLLLTLLI